jgi:hypothetical protein
MKPRFHSNSWLGKPGYSQTFSYLGMDFGGFINANCINGYKAELYENDIKAFIEKF